MTWRARTTSLARPRRAIGPCRPTRPYKIEKSYAAVQDREGLDDPAQLHLIGTFERILDGLKDYADAGVTDFRLEVAAHNSTARADTRAALADYLSRRR
jgi:hypothetical protein